MTNSSPLAWSRIAVRFYPTAGGFPDTTLASQLLGFVTQDGQGRYGVEQASQTVLAGAGNATADATGNAPLPQTGGSVQLTIDASLQLRLEKELSAAYIADRAPRVSGLVMDPYTGAILAWGSVPGYDENNYAPVAQDDPSEFSDPIASQVYEPGSVMKMFTSAAALEKGVVDLHDADPGPEGTRLRQQHRPELRQEEHGHPAVRGRHRQLAQRRYCQGCRDARQDHGRCLVRPI